MSTYEALEGKYVIPLACETDGDSGWKKSLNARLVIDGGWSFSFWVEAPGKMVEFSSLASACREYDRL